MQLYYFKDPLGNFGDDLNPWIWNKFIPTVLDDNQGDIFVGIGTLINNKLPLAPNKHVFGSGVGYGDIPLIDEKFNFHAVRGYHSALKLGLSPDKVITDSAILVSELFSVDNHKKKCRFGFMTTGETEQYFDWKTICDDIGIRHISCHLPVMDALNQISCCDIMICEAMHGAIVADSLGIPWIPVRCNENISDFKWGDWLSSMNMDYNPYDIPKIFNVERFGFSIYIKNNIKKFLLKNEIWKEGWSKPLPSNSNRKDIEISTEKLRSIMSVEPQLSSDLVRKLHLDKYLSLIYYFNKMYGSSEKCNDSLPI